MVESGVNAVDETRPSDGVDSELERALQGLRDVLGADGYRLDYAVESGRQLAVSVVAGPDACADCLAPKQLMEGILSDALKDTAYTVTRVEMPADHA